MSNIGMEDSEDYWEGDLIKTWEQRERRQLTSSETAPEIGLLPADKDVSEQQEASSEVEMTLRLK